MKTKNSFLALLAIAAGTLLGAASGCELIAGVDRTKIEATTGGTGGTATTGGGGTTTNPTTGGGGTTSSSGPCMDPTKDCPGDAGECKVWTCDATMACVAADAMDGTAATMQTAGDCKKNVCMKGASVSQNDDMDVEDDMTLCTTDTCSMGKPVHTAVSSGTTCSDKGGTVCDDMGKCVACNVDADCKDPLKPACDSGNHTCVDASCQDGKLNGGETDTDCGGPMCGKCDDTKKCVGSGDCKSNNCDVGGAKTCTAGTCNDGILNNAELGETDVDCGGMTCGKCNHDKTCAINADCKGDNCDTGGTKKCVANCSDTEVDQDETDVDCGGQTSTCAPCINTKTCKVAADCTSGFCNDTGGGVLKCAACSMDNQCGAMKYCNAGVCTPQIVQGQACLTGNQCGTGNCVDGLCCNTTCNGTCQACNVVGSLGMCTNVVANQTDDTCNGANKQCDGAGACKTTQGGTCAMGTDCFSGNCADSVCCNQACGGTCVACNVAGSVGTCTNVPSGQPDNNPANTCTGNNSCDGAGACKKINGQTCSTGTDCVSGSCADGVCCNTSCTGTCLSCNVAGSVGTCSNVPAGTQDGNAMTPCQGSNACNGAGLCKSGDGLACAMGSDCAKSNCIDGVCCNTSCVGLCKACNVAGSIGTCSFIPAGTDPDNECSPPNPNCDGAGVCN